MRLIPGIKRLLVVGVVVITCALSLMAQNSLQEVSGRWVWKQIAKKDKPQTQFRLVIRREGKVLRGIYSVDEFINDKWQGEDGNQTPFIGHVKGNEIQIEFDPLATKPGYQQHVTYAAPSDGRKPSMAIITRSRSTLGWRLGRGPGIEGVPTNVTLIRENLRREKDLP